MPSMNPYEQLSTALAAHEICCEFQAPGQMVVSNQSGAIWPDRGNSFWVTQFDGAWYLFTWNSVGYAVPLESDLASLCRVCMERGTVAMYAVPPDIAQRFALRELDGEEADRLLGGMAGPT
jgi:hypothetical protein